MAIMSKIMHHIKYWQKILDHLEADANGDSIISVVTTEGEIVPPQAEKKALKAHLKQMTLECLKELKKIKRYEELNIPYESRIFYADSHSHISDNSTSHKEI